MLEIYNGFLWGMTALAVVVFFALYHVRAGYGLLRDGHWGPQIGNRRGWFLMESPVFLPCWSSGSAPPDVLTRCH